MRPADPTPRLVDPDHAPPTAGYSHAVALPPGGELVWTSGQIALDEDGRVVGAGDWERQARQVFANVGRALAAAGAAWADVVKLTIYVTDLAGLPALRAVRDEHVDVARPPTSSLVQVAGLVHPDLLLEVEAVAWRPAGGPGAGAG